MKVYIYKTSDNTIEKGVVREADSLEKCIETLIKETNEQEYIVLTMSQYYGEKDLSDCSWMIEIYDDYRE